MSFNRHPPYSLLYTWAALLTLLQVYLWEEPKVLIEREEHHPAPACRTCFRRLLREPLNCRDKRLVEHLRRSIEPGPAPLTPSPAPSPEHPPWADVISYNSTERVLRLIFGEKRGGVFVEVGAQDGLWLSNTWWLEAARGWRGLLIEADPHNYARLRASPRTSTTLPACVATSLLTTQELLVRRNATATPDAGILRHQQGHTKLGKYATDSDYYAGHTFTATCYPIFSVLLAAGIRTIDLLTFDVTSGGFDMMSEFLEHNKNLGNKFKVKAILYQDNELPQLISMTTIKDQLKEFGYSLMQINMNHFLVYLDVMIKIVGT